PSGPRKSLRPLIATTCLLAAAAGGALTHHWLGSPAGAPGTEPAAGRARAALDSAAELALPRAAHAALPAEVDGQPLPSLADMLERVTPAVVNIYTRHEVRVLNQLAEFFSMQYIPRQQVQLSPRPDDIVDAELDL